MAIRQFQIPGKLINVPTVAVNRGPTGQFGFSWSVIGTPAAIFQTVDNYVGETQSLVGAISLWFYYTTASGLGTDSNWMLRVNNSVGTQEYSTLGLDAGAPDITLKGDAGIPPAIPPTVLNATATTVASVDTWHHLLVSWDLTSGNTFADDFHMYLDDVDVKPGSGTFNDGTLVEWGGDIFATGRLEFGNLSPITPAWAMAAIWFTHDEYIDFSVEANRRKFIDANGLPVALGVDGSIPTGTQPPFYFDDPVATILANRGSAGAFQTGAGATLVDVDGPNP